MFPWRPDKASPFDRSSNKPADSTCRHRRITRLDDGLWAAAEGRENAPCAAPDEASPSDRPSGESCRDVISGREIQSWNGARLAGRWKAAEGREKSPCAAPNVASCCRTTRIMSNATTAALADVFSRFSLP